MASSVTACTQCGQRNRVPAAASGTPRCGTCKAALPWIGDAGDGDFASVVEQAPVPVLLDLWATWCGPCRMVSPALERIATDRRGRIKLVKVDVDKAPRLSQVFEIRAVPTLMVWRDGQLLARQPGAAPEPMLRQWLDDALSAGQAGSGDQPGNEER
jgi:thioredoxin 2